MAKRTSKVWKSTPNKLDLTEVKLSSSNVADYVTSMEEKDINYEFIMNLFGSFEGKNIANPYDILVVAPGKFKYTNKDNKEVSNKEEFTTTLGIYIFNLLIAGCGLTDVVGGYLNKNINKKGYKSIEKALSYALIEDDITVDQLKKWENTTQWLMPFEDVLSPNHTEKFVTCTKVINKKKEELLKKYEKEIAEGDIVVAEQIEKELISYAKEYLGDDPSIDMLLSNAGASWDNTFKNMYLMRGAIGNPDPNAKQKYNIVTSNYIDGIKPEEYPTMAGSGAFGAYSRGKKTETGGYWEKLFVSAFQHIKLDPKGSDCGTDKYIEVLLTEKNYDMYMYSYMIINGSLKLLTSKNYKDYLNKKIKFRFSSMCKSKSGICNMCAGELLYQGIDVIGPVMSQVPSTLKNAAMSQMHSLQTSTHKMDVMKAFYPFEDK